MVNWRVNDEQPTMNDNLSFWYARDLELRTLTSVKTLGRAFGVRRAGWWPYCVAA